MNQNSNQRTILIATAVIIIIAVIVVGVIVTSKPSASNSPTPTLGTSSSNDTGTSTNTEYKDGSYTATGNYSSPGGSEKITVTVTLKDGVITDTSAESGATDQNSQEYQEQFISGYKSLVVGKSITSVNLSRVSGSSLTSQGFNSALSQIKSQAQS